MSKFTKLATVLVLCFNLVNAEPSIKFEVNRNAALFAQAYFDKDVSDKLYQILEDSLSNYLENPKEKIEFVEYLIQGKRENKYLTGKFITTWDDVLVNYDPVFDRNLDVLNNRKQELDNRQNQIVKDKIVDLEDLFTFYKTSLSNKTVFRAYIYPTSSSDNYVDGVGDNLFVRFCYGKVNNDFCLMYQKICNRLFETISRDDLKLIEQYFMTHSSKHAKAAYFILNDVLSYTIGNLWLHSKLCFNSDSFGKKHENENINKISLATLPMVTKYLESKKPIDKEFFEEYIKNVGLQYPKACLKYDVMLSKISLIVENGINRVDCVKLLQSNFPIKEIKFKTSLFSTIFIGNNLGDPILFQLQAKIPNKTGDFMFVTQDPQGKMFIIIKSNNEDKIKKAIEILKQQNEIQLEQVTEL